MKKQKNIITSEDVRHEALRYLENAADILKTKGNQEFNFYMDKKYVKMASHTAYTGVLFALDHALKLPKKSRNTEQEYVKALSAQNRKMMIHFDRVYHIFHLSGGYDGNGDKRTLEAGFDAANELIAWCANKIS